MMDSKAEALAAVKQRIISLQKQMSARILDMAAEVENLTEVATEREAREFLRVTCNALLRAIDLRGLQDQPEGL